MSEFPCPRCGVSRASLTSPCDRCDWALDEASPTATDAVVANKVMLSEASATPLLMLLFAWLFTLLLALLNTLQEGYPLIGGGGWFLTLIAGISQLPGLAFAIWRWKTRSVAALPFLYGAFVVATTGMLAYVSYVAGGKADDIHTAAHLHVIAFPVLHSVFAGLVYLVCSVVSMLLNRS